MFCRRRGVVGCERLFGGLGCLVVDRFRRAAVVLLLGLVFCARIPVYTLGTPSGCLRCLLFDAAPKLLCAVLLDGVELFTYGLNPSLELDVVDRAIGDKFGLARRDRGQIRGDWMRGAKRAVRARCETGCIVA